MCGTPLGALHMREGMLGGAAPYRLGDWCENTRVRCKASVQFLRLDRLLQVRKAAQARTRAPTKMATVRKPDVTGASEVAHGR